MWFNFFGIIVCWLATLHIANYLGYKRGFWMGVEITENMMKEIAQNKIIKEMLK